MKRIIVLFVLLFSCVLQVDAQNFERIFPDQFTDKSEMVSAFGDKILFKSKENIFLLDEQGHTLSKKKLAFPSKSLFNDNGNIVIVYNKTNSTNNPIYFDEYDINWNLINSFRIDSSSSILTVGDMIPAHGGGFVITANSFDERKVYKIDSHGVVIWSKYYPEITLGGISYNKLLISSVPDGYILNGYKTGKISVDGTLSWIIDDASLSAVETEYGHYFLAKLGKIRLYDTSGNLLMSQNVTKHLQLLKLPNRKILGISDYIYIINFDGTISEQIKQNGLTNNLFYKDPDHIYFAGNIYQQGVLNCPWLVRTDTSFTYRGVSFVNLLDGGILSAFTNYKIKWFSTGINYINITYSIDNGQQWNVIANNLPADSGYFDWVVPGIISTVVFFKIEDSEDPGYYYLNFTPIKIYPNFTYEYIAANEVKMWVSNSGDGSHNPINDGSGFYWPGGENNTGKSAIFEDGLLWAGKINGEVRANGNDHRQGLKPGIILPNGTPANPDTFLYQVFKLKNNFEQLPPDLKAKYQFNYENWPVSIGAPFIDVDDDGVYTYGIDKPRLLGEETLFYTANDMDTNFTAFTYGTNPIGLEFQTLVYAFNEAPHLDDVVFKKYTMINKGNYTVEDMYLGYWSDPDLGDMIDDYVASLPAKNFGYCFNATNNDGIYGSAPPAVGYSILQGPIIPGEASDSAFYNGNWKEGYKNLPMTAFTLYLHFDPRYRDPSQGIPQGAIEMYNNMKGLIWDGEPFIDPTSGDTTKFILSGNPVTQTGWHEGMPGGFPPGDRRMILSSGPFNLAPGDTQEIVIAIMTDAGTNNLNSITKLIEKADVVKSFYLNNHVVSVKNGRVAPAQFTLYQNYPNPFNPTTKIKFSIPASAKIQNVSLKIFDVLGREVVTLVNKEYVSGTYEVTFDASNYASGLYIYKLTAGSFTQSKKLLLIK